MSILCRRVVAPVTVDRRFRVFGTTLQTQKSSTIWEK